MIAKLRYILGLQTAEEKLEEYTLLKGELSDINDRTDILAEDYVTKLNGFNDILKSESYSTEIKERVQKRYTHFLQEQKKEVISLVNRRHKIEKSITSILKDENIKDAVNEFELLEKAKSNYRDGNISKNVYNDIIKAKKGKVHYSDNFVFWDGKLLLIQRATDDDGANKWGVPGGHVDAGESHEDAAVRELQEETGLVVDKVVLAGTYSNDDVMIEYYTSHIESDTEPQLVLDTAEHQSYRSIDLYRDNIDELEFPFSMKENIKKLLLPKEEKPQDISKAVNLFIDGFISKEVLSDIVKARSGVYKNAPENRKLGRVGQKYGSKKEVEKKEEVQNNFSYSRRDYVSAYPEDDSGSIEDTINKFISNLTGDKSDRVGSQYYRTGKKINGKNAVIRVSDHSHSERNTLGSEYVLSIIVDSDESSSSRFEDEYSELVVSERNLDDAIEAVEDFLNDVEYNNSTSVEKAFELGLISQDVFEKARAGRYADTSENRRLKRVGQPYGSKKGEDTKETKEPSKQEETANKQGRDIPIDQHAREASETALQEAAKGGNEELRVAAKKELERREKEENASDQPEKENVSADTEKNPGEEKPPVSEKENPTSEKEIRERLKYLDEKIGEISDSIDEEYKGSSFMTRAKEKRKNPDFVEYNKEFDDLKEELARLKESKPKVESIEEDSGYKMFHRPNEDGAPSYDLTDGDISLPKDFYENPEMYGNIKEETYKESLDVLKKIKGNPDAEVTIYRATPGKEINDGDWVTLSKEYAKIHNKSVLGEGGNILEMKVKAKNLKFSGDDIREFGYFEDKENVSAGTEKKPGEEKPPVSEKEKDESLTTEERQKNFKEWFGDSKVVDDNGNPMVVFHGTSADFNEFSKENFSAGAFGKGFYFTPSRETSEIFADKKDGDRVMEVYLSLKNPFVIEDGDSLIDNFKKYTTDDLVKNKGLARDFSLHLKEKGYDGVIFKDDDVKYKDQWEYIAFEPNQIKSATGNKGTFDAKSNDINKSVPNADDIQKSLLDELQDYKIKQLIAIADSSDISKATAARTILKEKLNL